MTQTLRVASLSGSSLEILRSQLTAVFDVADAIELRLDHLQKLDIDAVKNFCTTLQKPSIFTLRTVAQGGQCDWNETSRLTMIKQLAALAPSYIDLESEVPSEFAAQLKNTYPHLKLIRSHHNFQATPADLDAVFDTIYHPIFDVFKIATLAHDSCDTLRLLKFVERISQQHPIVGIAMGENGTISRILAPIVGSCMTYGSVDETSTTAPGQLTLAELTSVYHFPALNRNTKIYALLGCPITQSPGHLFHNQAFTQLSQNAVYVKIKVLPEQLAATMALLRQLPFAGFSVTIPHKETIVEFIDELNASAKTIRTVNTVKRIGNEYWGFNTDGSAGADILAQAMTLQNANILILGAGGSAKALAYELMQRGANITLCNRTLPRAKDFTQQFGGSACDFATLFALKKLPYQAIINTLPVDAYLAQCKDWQLPADQKRLAMDIILKPLNTPFLQAAQHAGYHCINGEALFLGQAKRQLEIWFNKQP